MIALALDGPFNGEYLTRLTAEAAGYQLNQWPTGEDVWLHVSGSLSEPAELATDA